MILRTAERLDPASSRIVGDRPSDLEAGHTTGLAGGLHVLTGHDTAEHTAAAVLQSGASGCT